MSGITRMTASGILIPEDKQAVEQAAKREKIKERVEWALGAFAKVAILAEAKADGVEIDPAVTAAVVAEMMRQDAR